MEIIRRFLIQLSTVCCLFFAALMFSCPGDAHALEDRQAVWAGKFYPSSSAKLTASVNQFTEKALQNKVVLPEAKDLKALIMPHAGYVYSGYTAAHTAHVLTEDRFDTVVLIGPDHRVGFRYGAVSEVAAYQTPLGRIELDEKAARLRQNNFFQASSASDRSEHSLEVILPFLQTYMGSFKVIPIVVGGMVDTRGEMTKQVSSLMDSETLIVVSSDLSHYLPYDQAVQKDKKTLEVILGLDNETLFAEDNRACGIRPIAILLDLARHRNWQPILLNYTNSGDTAGSKDQVVGYAAIAFFGEKDMAENTPSDQISKKQGQVLCRLARETIKQKLNQIVTINSPDLEKALMDSIFDQKRGVFVTLHLDGKLRGCIGSLTGSMSIKKGVENNAANAAFSDYRFKPLTKKEFDKIEIEISVLTEPQPLEYSDADDLIRKLRPGVDGVILSLGTARSTFLPQVWDQLPDTAAFLSHLSAKAGLQADAWRTNKLEVKTYQVQYFEEGKY